MRSTFRMIGLADIITLLNGLFGASAILLIVLAVEELQHPFFENGVRTTYIWAAMGCILLSVFGDAIDGPIARRYSKTKILGGSLDIMSDCISFCLAPALLMFVMFGRWGQASPVWTISLAVASCWIIVTGMLRLARFHTENDSETPYFNGLASPGSALLLITVGALIWLQPSSGLGPEVSTNCMLCLSDSAIHEKPYFESLILPVMFLTGALMISDRKLPKTKSGLSLKLTIIQFFSLIFGIVFSMDHITPAGIDLRDMGVPFSLFFLSLLLVIFYITYGPTMVAKEQMAQAEQIDFESSSESAE